MIELYGKNLPLEKLHNYIRTGNFPHALLLCGDKGTGKSVLARYIAMLYMCEKHGGSPCGNCVSCVKIENFSHPDVIYVRQAMEKEKYNVKELRQMISKGYNLPNDGGLRVYIFQGLDSMSDLCQNVLLKFMEEPLPFNRCIFTADALSGILETVISRLTIVPVVPAPLDECARALISKGYAPDEAASLAAGAGGNIGAAIRNAGSDIYAAADTIYKSVLNKNEYKTAVTFAKIKSRDSLVELLDLLLLSFSAAMSAKTDPERENIPLSLEKLYRICSLIEDFIKQLDSNPNVSLATAFYASEISFAAAK